jgi:DNA-binding CsgD family transcriptional regulator
MLAGPRRRGCIPLMTSPSLDSAAWGAWARGAVDDAVRHALDAWREQPDADEKLRLAAAFALRGHRVDLLADELDAIAALPHGVERDAVAATVRLGHGDLPGALALRDALADTRRSDPEPDPRVATGVGLRAATLGHLGLGALSASLWGDAHECAAAARALLDAHPSAAVDDGTRYDLLGIAAIAETHTSDSDDASRNLEAALAPLRARNLLGATEAFALLYLAHVQHIRGDLGKAAINLVRGIRLAGDRRPALVAQARVQLALIRIRQGRWADATAEVDAVVAPSNALERTWIETQTLAVRALLAGIDGDHEAAARMTVDAERRGAGTPSYLASIALLHGRLASTIARGRWRELRQSLDDAEEPGYRHPYRPGEWNALRMLATWHLGDVGETRDRLTAWAQRPEAAVDPYHWAFVTIVAEHDHRHTDGLAAIERALETLRLDDDPLGRAWVHMVAGTYLGRHGAGGDPDPRRALAMYDLALGELRQVGAHVFAARCEAIVAALTAELDDARRTRPAAVLTDQQHRIARAVAQGYTSDEIAAIEYLSTRTIDYHVANILRRLGVGSRREIGRALGED